MTLAWEPLEGHEADTAAPLDLPRGDVERVRVAKRNFDRIADKRNFYLPASDVPIDSGRWRRIKQRFDPN